jgi:predicted membrane protein
MDRDNLRGFAIVIAIAAVATVFFEVSTAIFSAILGAISLIFICLLWYFGYGWYQRNRMAISLMPDRQRNILYLGLGAVTVSAALYSLAQFQLIDLGAFSVPVLPRSSRAVRDVLRLERVEALLPVRPR